MLWYIPRPGSVSNPNGGTRENKRVHQVQGTIANVVEETTTAHVRIDLIRRDAIAASTTNEAVGK
jgi:hypothetical protein